MVADLADVDPEVGEAITPQHTPGEEDISTGHVDGPEIIGKSAKCCFFKFENPDNIIPEMECKFKAYNPQELKEHIGKEHYNIKKAFCELKQVQNLFKEILESQNREDVNRSDIEVHTIASNITGNNCTQEELPTEEQTSECGLYSSTIAHLVISLEDQTTECGLYSSTIYHLVQNFED